MMNYRSLSVHACTIRFGVLFRCLAMILFDNILMLFMALSICIISNLGRCLSYRRTGSYRSLSYLFGKGVWGNILCRYQDQLKGIHLKGFIPGGISLKREVIKGNPMH